jgi:hypothetical protein
MPSTPAMKARRIETRCQKSGYRAASSPRVASSASAIPSSMLVGWQTRSGGRDDGYQNLLPNLVTWLAGG